MPSPNADWGYDVSDYVDVHPDLGTLADLDALVAAAGETGSTSSSISSRTTPATGTRGSWRRGPPGMRPAATGTSGRTRSRRVAPEQLALVLRRTGVDARRGDGPVLPAPVPARAARPELVERRGAGGLDEILRFWFARGIAGFRIDVPQVVVKDALLRDNPPLAASDPWYVQTPRAAAGVELHAPGVAGRPAPLAGGRRRAGAAAPLVGEGTIDSRHMRRSTDTGKTRCT